jgi:endonuclease/exonuclease/phosphatase family metal-dependent hydrolase
MGYIIGSFNIQKLGEAAVKQLRRDFSLIAKVIREERMDIVALQEIFGDPVRHYVVSMLQNHLNHAGAMSWNASYVRSLKSDEGYAFNDLT